MNNWISVGIDISLYKMINLKFRNTLQVFPTSTMFAISSYMEGRAIAAIE